MDFVFPIVLLLVVVAGVALAPTVAGLGRRLLWGIAVLRSELLVQAAQRNFRKTQHPRGGKDGTGL